MEESEPHGDDDFDVEAYLKWRKEHPDSEGEGPGGAKGAEAGGELPEDDDEDDDDYDEEDDD